MELYKWQKDCLGVWRNHGYRGIIHVVTGAGKTVFAIAAVRELRKKYPELRVRIVVPSIPLARQWLQRFLLEADCEENRPGLFGGDRRDRQDRPVMVYIINSARKELAGSIRRDFSLGRHVLLIADECHHYQSRENRHIFDFLEGEGEKYRALYASLGLSATPFSSGGDELLRDALGEEIYLYGHGEAVRDGTISPFVVCRTSVSFLPDENREYAELTDRIRILLARLLKAYPDLKGLSEHIFMKKITSIAKESGMDPDNLAAAFLLMTYRRKEISVLANARLQCCVDLLSVLRTTDRILIFSERISQAEELYRILTMTFGKTGIYHSGISPEGRKATMEAFRDNRIRILVSCKCLDEGIDVPDANIGIVLSGSAVARQRIQRLGRIIRISRQKDAACLYYFYIRESSDESSFLPGLEENESFDMRYYSQERAFACDLYEYTCGQILDRAGKSGMPPHTLEELRSCMTEGLPRADCYLPEEILDRNIHEAGSVHEKNYWRCMKKIGMERGG